MLNEFVRLRMNVSAVNLWPRLVLSHTFEDVGEVYIPGPNVQNAMFCRASCTLNECCKLASELKKQWHHINLPPYDIPS